MNRRSFFSKCLAVAGASFVAPFIPKPVCAAAISCAPQYSFIITSGTGEVLLKSETWTAVIDLAECTAVSDEEVKTMMRLDL